jgi:fucose permease
LLVLHITFALTGILQAVNGPLLPSLASTFHLNDSESGLLFLLYFAGTSTGALLCRSNYARTMTVGFLALAAGCLGVAVANRVLLFPIFLILGIGVGMPMSAVSLFVGRNFAARCAPTLTFLNFSWSIGALAAPLLAAPLLMHHTYRVVYLVLALAAALAALACWFQLEDASESARSTPETEGMHHLRLIVFFAFIAFLDVGVENTVIAWLSTYSLRSVGGGLAAAAAASSLYWCGFLVSRGVSSLLLLRVEAIQVFRVAVVMALAAAVLLAALPSSASRGVAFFLLGAALAPLFPLLLATFLVRVRHTSDTRWVLALCGFGGSVLPWLTGWISTHTGSLRLGLITIPVALLIMIGTLPALGNKRPVAAGE